MSEIINARYRRLFEIRLLHHYWLDDGVTGFDQILPPEKRDQRLLSYDRRSFLEVAPTADSSKVIDAVGGVYQDTALGCLVAVPNSTVFPAETGLEFWVRVNNPAVFNYTSLTIRLQKIYEIYYQPEEVLYRYKEDVPVLSNLTGAARGTGANKALFLSREFPALAPDDQVESLVLSGAALMQLTGDQPGAGLQQLGTQAATMPVFVHQGDVPAITPPPDLDGAPAQGVRLTADLPDNIWALIRLSPQRPDDADFSFIDNAGHAKTTPPVFQVRWKNRATIWKYLNKNTGAVAAVEPKPLPLTRYGNAGTKQKPSEGLVQAVKSGNRITQLVSNIFI